MPRNGGRGIHAGNQPQGGERKHQPHGDLGVIIDGNHRLIHERLRRAQRARKLPGQGTPLVAQPLHHIGGDFIEKLKPGSRRQRTHPPPRIHGHGRHGGVGGVGQKVADQHRRPIPGAGAGDAPGCNDGEGGGDEHVDRRVGDRRKAGHGPILQRNRAL